MFRISSRVHGSVDLVAAHWLSALGDGLVRLGVTDSLDRMACEVLPNGTILVRDVRTGSGYIVQPILDAVADEVTEEGSRPIEYIADLAPITVDTADAELRPASLLDEIEEIHRAPTDAGAVKQALDALLALVPAEAGSVLLRQPDDTLAFAASFGAGSETLANVSLPAGTGVAGFCVRRLTVLVLKDPYADPRFFKEVDTVTGIRTRSLLCVPIAYEKHVFGCIELVNGFAEGSFGHDAMTDAEILANALAQRLTAGEPLPGRA